MSKKDKSKFKKLIKAQVAQEIAQAQKEVQPNKSATIVIPDSLKKINEPKAVISDTNTVTATPIAIGEINLPQIKYDLKKTGIVIGGLAIIMLGLYFLDLKYGILLNFGNWLFKVLNIQ